MEETNQPKSPPASSSSAAIMSEDTEFAGDVIPLSSVLVSEVIVEEQNQEQVALNENEDHHVAAFTCTISNESFSCIVIILILCCFGLFSPLLN